MSNRTVFHVTPNVNSWMVRQEGSDQTEYLVDDKDDAVRHARDLAKAAELGQVIVHNRDGKIAEEFTYGDDPRSIPG
jgi:hypothetical protein